LHEKREKISQYKGVSYNKKSGKWYARFHLARQKKIYGGIFNDELDAAKRVNELCEELGFPQQNSTLSAIPNQQYQVTKKIVFCVSMAL
jgi:hypothetical protein